MVVVVVVLGEGSALYLHQCFEISLLQRIDMSSCRDQDIWVHGWLEMVVNNEFAHFDTYNTSANI